MLPYMLAFLPVIVLVRGIVGRILKRRGFAVSLWREAGICVFFMFLAGLASVTILPSFDVGVDAISIVNIGMEGGLNLIPGKVFVDSWRVRSMWGDWSYFIVNFLGNIGIFVPIGFAVALLWRGQSLRKTALIGLGISLFIELCQLPQLRTTDVDDLWLNTLGAVIGYGLYALLNRRFTGLFSKFKLEAFREMVDCERNECEDE